MRDPPSPKLSEQCVAFARVFEDGDDESAHLGGGEVERERALPVAPPVRQLAQSCPEEGREFLQPPPGGDVLVQHDVRVGGRWEDGEVLWAGSDDEGEALLEVVTVVSGELLEGEDGGDQRADGAVQQAACGEGGTGDEQREQGGTGG